MIEKFVGLYGRFVAKHPLIILIFVLIVTALAINQATHIDIKSLKYEDMLSKDLEVVQALDLVKDKFKGVSTMQVVVEIDPKYYRPTEVDLLLGDASKARKVLNWQPKVDFKALAKMMTDADMKIAEREKILKDCEKCSDGY